MVLRRILTCHSRLAHAKRTYRSKLRTANHIAVRPLVSQSRGTATNSLWGRDWENDELVSEDRAVANILNEYFSNVTKFLNIADNDETLLPIDGISDPVTAAIENTALIQVYF